MATEVRALKPSEVEAHGELVFISYTHQRALDPNSEEGRFLTQPDWWTRGAAGAGDYDPETTRVMAIDGKLVCSVTCFPRPSYIAGRVANTVCIGSVCTHPSYRRRGLLRQVLAESTAWMRSQRIPWSFLYGDEAIYGGSGWRHLTAWTVRADIRVRDDIGRGLTARPVDIEADLPALMGMYDRLNSRLIGPTVRSEHYWRNHVLQTRVLERDPEVGHKMLLREGRPIGYYAGANGDITEIGWVEDPREVLAFVLRQWPGQEVSLPLCTAEVLTALRDVSANVGDHDLYARAGGITLRETSCGLWQYHGDPDGLFPEFSDTEGLLRFLRAHEYAMWVADES